MALVNDTLRPNLSAILEAGSLEESLALLDAYSFASASASNICISFPADREGVVIEWTNSERTQGEPRCTRIVATRAIPAGSELLRSYGSLSWVGLEMSQMHASGNVARFEALCRLHCALVKRRGMGLEGEALLVADCLALNEATGGM